jgi:phosphate acetyltransferase
MKKALFIAATGQNVGKTTTCLGLVSGLKKRFKRVGFMKPVGQEHVETENNLHVDKDVVLFKNYFNLHDAYEDMSPVLFPKGFTRDFLDNKIPHEDLTKKISSSYSKISAKNNITIVEGTGHTGVGSIVDLNNAQVASLLGIEMIMVASGGLGSSFDELALNKAQCEKYGVPIAGIILNRVLSDKKEMIEEYMSKALKSWQIPLLGIIPYNDFLSTPSMEDFELLFQTKLLTGIKHRLRHFDEIRLVASSVDHFRGLITPNTLIITPASREDIILATLTKYWDQKISMPDEDLGAGLILTGHKPPKESILDQLKKAGLPALYIPVSSFIAMKMITSFTAKIRKKDVAKIEEAIRVVESHIDFDQIDKILKG